MSASIAQTIRVEEVLDHHSAFEFVEIEGGNFELRKWGLAGTGNDMDEIKETLHIDKDTLPALLQLFERVGEKLAGNDIV